MNFKVGDIIVGNDKSDYTHTRAGILCRVERLSEMLDLTGFDNMIEVQILPGQVELGFEGPYLVSDRCFDLSVSTDTARDVIPKATIIKATLVTEDNRMSMSDKVTLLMAKVEILKLKANDYAWQCETPKDVKIQLDGVLAEIESMIGKAE